MTWFFERPDRFVAERRGLTALDNEVDWLTHFEFALDGRSRLLLRFTLFAAGKPVELELRYPALYPDVPPEIVPVDPSLRLADHQWTGGSLCLEYRGDNWRSEITGAAMIRSAYKLLAAETEVVGGIGALPSVHDLTPGQILRAKTFRHLYSDEIIEKLKGAAPLTPMMATLRWDYQSETFVSWIGSIDMPGGRWQQPVFPDRGCLMHGVAMWVPEGPTAEAYINPVNAGLPAFLAGKSRHTQVPPEDANFVFVASDDTPRVIWRSSGKADLISLTTIHVGGRGIERAATDPSILHLKKVAIAGCGSAGSKIAATLARAGVRDFLLIDDDVLMRENLVRNELDWNGVGEHKVHALGTRLKLINPDVVVTGRAHRLVGLEASSSVDTALEALSNCDLIVDATASADAFNLISAVATRFNRPLVWLEVYEGGLGGMVARHRPGIDASPKEMRSAYLSWCRDRNAPWLGTAEEDYASRDGTGSVLVADDAEVGVIASHAARFALDGLVNGNAFPNPMYVIGMRARWIFNVPFDVHPIDIQSEAGTQEASPLTQENCAAAIEFLGELLAKRNDENRTA